MTSSGQSARIAPVMTTPLTARPVRTVWALTMGGTIVWLGLILLAPWLAARGEAGVARVIYAVFAPVCHQIPDRCFVLAGHPLAVCGRCLGIYTGFLAGLVLYPLVRGFSRLTVPGPRFFLLATLPLALDGLAGVLGVWESPIGVRLATGLVWGALLPFYFVTGVADLVRLRRERRRDRGLANSSRET
jgi:uncharacterized membrane protein